MKVQNRIVARLRRLVADAEKAGVALVADGDGGIRVMTAEEAKGNDIRHSGAFIRLHEGCGGAGSDMSGGGKWM